VTKITVKIESWNEEMSHIAGQAVQTIQGPIDLERIEQALVETSKKALNGHKRERRHSLKWHGAKF